jgi:GH43 family beta-xylosidase
MLKTRLNLWICVLLLLSLGACRREQGKTAATPPESTAQATTFQNPLLPSGPDPWVLAKDGYYYYTHTTGNNITLWKTKAISDLGNASGKIVWRPPTTGPNSRNIWAPEIHFLTGKWYIYYAADDGRNENHRLWVLENDSPDPVEGNWIDRGQITDPTNKWAIDGSVAEIKGQTYFVWSGWEGDVNVSQHIYMARLKNPWTIDGKRVLISQPTYDWERLGDPDVNEGPQFLQKNGRVFLTYSGSGCWTDDYAMGLLSLRENADPLDASAWTKSPVPVFTKAPEKGVFGPGHNSFFQSPDGSEDWILYHANPQANGGCGRLRSPRMQQFTWNADSTPHFGQPVPIFTALSKPSGE